MSAVRRAVVDGPATDADAIQVRADDDGLRPPSRERHHDIRTGAAAFAERFDERFDASRAQLADYRLAPCVVVGCSRDRVK